MLKKAMTFGEVVQYAGDNSVSEIVLVEKGSDGSSRRSVKLMELDGLSKSGTFKVLNLNEGKLYLTLDLPVTVKSRAVKSKRKTIYISPMISEHDHTWKLKQVVKLLDLGHEVHVILDPRYKLKKMYVKHGQQTVDDNRTEILSKMESTLRSEGYAIQKAKQGLLVKMK